jgi:hypothetical protein
VKIQFRVWAELNAAWEHWKEDTRTWAQLKLVRVERHILAHQKKMADAVNLAEWKAIRARNGGKDAAFHPWRHVGWSYSDERLLSAEPLAPR